MDVCGQCGDDFGEHSLIKTTGDVMDGGVVICPRRNCMCYSTWSPHYPGQEAFVPKDIPTEEELAGFRERLWQLGRERD
jgi:hypothetical protein